MIKRITLLILTVCVLFSFSSCNNATGGNTGENPDGTSDSGTGDHTEELSYTVRIATPGGAGVGNALVYVHKSDAEFDVAGKPLLTDSDGYVTFTLPQSDEYSVQVVNLHERYLLTDGEGPHGRHAFNGTEAKITVDYNTDYHPSVYQVGDKIADFTVSDVYGNEHTLSELLKTRDMVMINLWFTGCGPCAAEFPVINTAYGEFGENIEILAISDYPTDSVEKVKNYPVNKNLSIDFPLIYDKTVFSPLSFGSEYYPTTVIIDRYGVICMIEIGSVTSLDKWTNTFAFFTSDNYVQNYFNGMSDIPEITD